MVSMRISVKLRSKVFDSCIGRNELILGEFELCWMVVVSRNKNVPIFMLAEVNHRFTRSTKVFVDREGECRRWRSGVLLGWWFSDHAASIKSRSREFKTSVMWCWMFERLGVCSSLLVSQKNLVFTVLPS